MKITLSFLVPENGKKVILYNINDRTLNYALVRKDNTVEFSYPIETIYQNPDFSFDSSLVDRSVTFSNRNTTYKIYEKSKELGIQISTNGKTINLIGDVNARREIWTFLLKTQLDNFVKK